MVRRNSDVDVREHKKQRAAVAQDHEGQEQSQAGATKLGDPVHSNAGDLEADMLDSSDTTDPMPIHSDSNGDSNNRSQDTSTMQDLVDEVRSCMLDQDCSDVANAFVSAVEQPPITLDSLAELEINRIISNPKLRHDVNFDRELHFRPNLDGHRGQQKIKQTEDYWKAIVAEISIYARVQQELAGAYSVQNTAYWNKVQADSEKRLPELFTAIKDIIYTLVPDYDQEVVKERLDAKFLMQEIKNGVCDLAGLADWLAKMLKCHCAPMRDHMVDRMRAEIIQGTVDGRAETLVNGIRQLMNVLEAMKLDVANHQIRYMRPTLVTETVQFSRRYNAHRIVMAKVDVVRSRNWLDYEMETITRNGDACTHVEALTSALLRGLVLNIDNKNLYPQTFYLDGERLKTISSELHMSIYKEVCCDILRDMTLGCPPAALDQAEMVLKAKITSIVGSTNKFFERIEHIAAEIMRMVLEIEGRAGCIDADLMADVERRLDSDLCSPNSPVYEHIASEEFDRILPKLMNSVNAHLRLSAVQLQDALVTLAPFAPQARSLGFGARLVPAAPLPRSVDEDWDIVRRLTHIIALHWQTWAELVYLASPGDEGDSDSSNDGPSPPNSRSASPTVTIALNQPVYHSGHQFLPKALVVTEVPSRRPTPANAAPTDDADHAASNSTHDSGDAAANRRTIDPEQ